MVTGRRTDSKYRARAGKICRSTK